MKFWNRTFAISVAFNCAFSLVLFEYAVIDGWNWPQWWLLLIALPLVSLGTVLVGGWLMEQHLHTPNTCLDPHQLDPLQLGFTLRQERGEPLCQLVLELRPVGKFHLSDINGWSYDTVFPPLLTEDRDEHQDENIEQQPVSCSEGA